MKIHSYKVEIFYEDTDSSGFTYHTSYLRFAERARSKLVKERFPELMEKMKKNIFFFVVNEINIEFFTPSFLNDELTVNTFFIASKSASIDLNQIILRGEMKICKIFVKLVWINGKSNRPSRIPKKIIDRFNNTEIV